MAHGDQRGRAITDGALHHETARNKRGRSKGLLHDVDSLRNNTRQSPNFIKSESERQVREETAQQEAKVIRSQEYDKTEGPPITGGLWCDSGPHLERPGSEKVEMAADEGSCIPLQPAFGCPRRRSAWLERSFIPIACVRGFSFGHC